MKVLTIICVLLNFVFIFVGANTVPRKDEELVAVPISPSMLDQIFDILRMMIKEGSPEYGIPIMDPYEMVFAHVESSGDILRIKANITDGLFFGLGGFEILDFNFSKEELSLHFDVYFPSLNFTSEYYEMEGNIRDILPLAGKGVLHIEVYEFKLRSKIVFKQSENKKSILIDKLEGPQFAIKRIVSKTDFDNNIDGILNTMIEEVLAGYLNKFNKFLAATYSEPVVNSINQLLLKLELWKFYMPLKNSKLHTK